MTQQIKQQKQLMQAAIDKLYLIESAVPYVKEFDTTRAVVLEEQLQDEYCGIMTELFVSLSSTMDVPTLRLFTELNTGK